MHCIVCKTREAQIDAKTAKALLFITEDYGAMPKDIQCDADMTLTLTLL